MHPDTPLYILILGGWDVDKVSHNFKDVLSGCILLTILLSLNLFFSDTSDTCAYHD